MIVISHYQAKKILAGWVTGLKEVPVSLDLGRTLSKVIIKSPNVIFPDGSKIHINVIRKIALDTRSVYLIENNEVKKVQFFSEETQKFYKLVPTGENTPPTLEISGIHMHRIKDVDPLTDTLQKLELIKPLENKIVLDTCTGLGYTAIYARKLGAKKVITVEKDPYVIEIAKYNPWSKELFEDENIILYINDITKFIKNFEDETFDRIIHDPPRFSYKTANLYSILLYKEFYRVLKPGGKLVHYVGKPKHKRGFDLKKNVIRKLKEIGFRKIYFDERSLCVYAEKPKNSK